MASLAINVLVSSIWLCCVPARMSLNLWKEAVYQDSYRVLEDISSQWALSHCPD
jgi:hypothetical protein